LSIENYHDKINLNLPDIQIKVLYCNKYQIAIVDHNQILHCENALCDPKCNLNGQCIAGKNNVNNDPSKNDCECKPGYKGNFCESKNIEDYRYILLFFFYLFYFICFVLFLKR